MIRRMFTDPQLSGAVLNLLSTMTAEYRTPFDWSHTFSPEVSNPWSLK